MNILHTLASGAGFMLFLVMALLFFVVFMSGTIGLIFYKSVRELFHERPLLSSTCVIGVAIVILSLCVLSAGYIDNKPTKNTVAKGSAMAFLAASEAYRSDFGKLPQGGNAHTLAELRGGNERKIEYYAVNPRDLNSEGEFLDPWGSPYRIDTSDPAFPWAYSFGKNKIDDGGAPGSDDMTSW